MHLIDFYALLNGLYLTIVMAFFAAGGAIIFGSILAVLRNYGGFLSYFAGLYIEIFRNTPLLLWMYAACFVLPVLFKIPANYAVLGTIGLFLYTTSVMAEIIRGGLNAIPKGQFEAAQSQGFSFTFTLWYIIFPQCFRKVTPTILSQCVTTIKDTSFLAALNVAELTNVSKDIISRLKNFDDIISVFITVAGLYFIVCFSLSVLVRYLSRHNKF
ncbi:aspartate/glutamate ABC transporter, permease protein [Campylobacter avium LMG 24591]|uniref:Aspartate/glutamate ABC transporter, permease protein n=2 Tax=Campylobacter avium TaxID=522485 RepID=A0A222MUY9_9BACT|nr:amino acid ABC transporter permease [Campylobacter avium]ASQ29864.1 aspartate/glutamate ABC transporter, permease protein [Campylobacter avium LMG 24591]OYD78963.1 aspartate/glutamate ABC transporter, permease protein [Campylobacter avium]HJE66268.1 amino acid ABC transporter permease [Campylobacter avium]